MKIVLVQRVVPIYREALFESMYSQARSRGEEFEVYASSAQGEFRLRGTEGFLPWARMLRVFSFPRWLGTLEWQCLPWRDVRTADIVIVSDNLRVISNMAVLLLRRALGKPTLLWGHGTNFQPTGFSARLKTLRYTMLRLADKVLVYTSECVPPLLAAGFDPGLICVTDNAIDVSCAEGIRAEHPSVIDFRERNGLGDAPSVVFLGSWYERKRPELVISIGQILRQSIPDLNVIVVGGGAGLQALRAAGEHWLRVLGPLQGREKFIALAAAECLVVTGVAGLNLLDAMAVGLPVVAPDRLDHSPEIAYLKHGENGFLVPDDVHEIAIATEKILLNPELRRRMSASASYTASGLTIEGVASTVLDASAACADEASGA